MTQKPPPEVIFFLGAGASVKAGVPDTYQLVSSFQSHLQSDSGLSGIADAVDRILKVLAEWKASRKESDHRVDIELLLDALESLRTRQENLLLRFFADPKYLLEGYPEKGQIVERLRNFIKSEAIVDRGKIAYLDQLRGFALDYAPLDVFSVNYDTVVEQFCVLNRLQMTDGFESRWQPESFDSNTSGVRLYKLHGSITWYKTDLGDYVKVPILAQVDQIELVTGEKANSLILYPANKWEFDEPLLELLMLLKKRLESARFCIVVGYSFRDDHITRIFWDAARQNRELNLILISPSATEIYRSKLEHYPESQNIRSSLAGRVVSLPYKFEDSLSELRWVFLRNLSNGLRTEASAVSEELHQMNPDWMSILKMFIDAEHTERAQQIVERVGWDGISKNWNDKFQYSLKGWLISFVRRDEEGSGAWVKRFQNTLSLLDFSQGAIYHTGQVLNLWIAVHSSGDIEYKSLLTEGIRPVVALANKRFEMIDKSTANRLAPFMTAIGDIERYFAGWETGAITMEQYYDRLPMEVSRRKTLENAQTDWIGSSSNDELRRKLDKVIRDVESRRLDQLFISLQSKVNPY